MSYVHWQYQTAQGHPKPLTLDEFARIEDLREVLKVLSVEEKIKLLAVSLGLERSSWFGNPAIAEGFTTMINAVDDERR
jgi:hypothetical protein